MKLVKQTCTLIAGLAMVGATLTAVAQTGTTAPMGTTQVPAAVGVTPQAAAEANSKAVPRSDTATVIRTGPNAVDASRSAASTAQGNASTTERSNAASPVTEMRPAKADRN